ncbi:hypothetical protein MML48_3g00012184 [Holotrichia oblita]|uniref:Uncharacterized protein n=1 Tax=Holotrichia oblita TaxID=644536 RepID=A0ACB9TFG5_HOLOL|nr:hypothetical protein MML48_3g00012184 [Holotrichia oblita]
MSSSEQWSDDGKRKKEDGEFYRSKKTRRTPNKDDNPKENMTEQMNQIMLLLKNLAGDIREMKGKQTSNKEETKVLQEEIRKLRAEQEQFKEEIKYLRDIREKETEEIDNLKKQVRTANEEIERLKTEKRRKNVIVQGLEISVNNPKELKTKMENFIEKELGAAIKIESAIKLGEKTCLIELNSKDDKATVMSNKSKLRNHKQKIYINDDLTKKEREKQKLIRTFAKEETEKGKVVKIGYNRVIVNGEEWRWDKEKDEIKKCMTKN